ncbi:Crp/Fnr family transcriptional regulator [Listeria weihenstephanensis]|uniref:Crp/Fnr family transcriptional regulator n=1 Tax=Listeria weihenstephanensis TaxID=1006155 RepID=A0A841ZAG1_9LIST|nr:Crp/Fnr family transcriptional regulator [Listeria weihenstephanensis]MBC1501467.1 Crp/Fnr family transcriptional regulator [Listeria weihenstephanensis]
MLNGMYDSNRKRNVRNEQIFNQFFASYPSDFQKIELKKGEHIVLEDEAFKGVFFIRKGIAIKEVLLKSGKTQGIRLTTKNEFVGALASVNVETYPYDVRCLTDMECYKLSEAVLHQILMIYPMFLYEALQADSYTNYQKMKFITGKVEERIIYNIVELAECFGEKNDQDVWLPKVVTQEILASLSSTTREYVAKILASLKSINILDTKQRHIIVHDLHKLHELIY